MNTSFAEEIGHSAYNSDIRIGTLRPDTRTLNQNSGPMKVCISLTKHVQYVFSHCAPSLQNGNSTEYIHT
jgi:hypothetical protein